MSSKIVCDKCGKVIETPYSNTIISVTIEAYTLFAETTKYDFCVECFQEIKDFVAKETNKFYYHDGYCWGQKAAPKCYNDGNCNNCEVIKNE